MIQEASPPLTDEDIVRRVIEGETSSLRILIRRHNQRLYRAIRAILKDEAETEDAMQEVMFAPSRILTVRRQCDGVHMVNEDCRL